MGAEKLATGFQFLEGPVWVPARGELLFSDIPASRMYRWADGQRNVWREPSPHPGRQRVQIIDWENPAEDRIAHRQPT